MELQTKVFYRCGSRWVHSRATHEVVAALGLIGPLAGPSGDVALVIDPMPAVDAGLEEYLDRRWPELRRHKQEEDE